MTAMFRRAAVTALLCLAACTGEERISHVSQTSSVVSREAGPTRFFIKIEFTMPQRFPVEAAGSIAMTDTSGRRFEATESGVSTDSKRVQKINAKFEVAEGSRLGVLHVGDHDIDVPSRRITRRAATSTTP